MLVGLVTVKDVLKFTAMDKSEGDASWDELRGGFDGLLEEAYTWTMKVADTITSVGRRMFRR
jgi:chloride channel 3/4/5